MSASDGCQNARAGHCHAAMPAAVNAECNRSIHAIQRERFLACPVQGAYAPNWARVWRARSVIALQSPLAISSGGVSHDPPTATTLDKASHSATFASPTPPVGQKRA